MNERMLSVEDAKKVVHEKFPIHGYMNSALKTTDNLAKIIKKYIPTGSKILDFGSGPCDKTAVIQLLGYECSAIDDLKDHWHLLDNNRDKIIQFAKKFNIDFRVESNGNIPFEKESFDMVMSHDVLEHLHDSPRKLLNDLVELIKPNGLLFITVPNAVNIRKRIWVIMGKTNLPRFETYYWYPDPWRGHIREYVKSDLKLISEYLDLEILELRGCHHMLHVVPTKILPIYILATKIFQGWRDSWMLVARKPLNWNPKRELSNHELAKVLGKVSPFYRSEE